MTPSTARSAVDGAVPVLVNRQAGAVATLGRTAAGVIGAAFDAAGLRTRIILLDGAAIADAVRTHAAAPLLVIGGGDGTLGAGLAGRRGHGTTGLLPLGTRNHLARDLGVATDLHAAARVIAAGHTRTIDLASVNGHGFVNNASVGLYPLMVRRREARTRGGLPKWLATLPAAWAALARLPHHRLHLHGPVACAHDVRTPLLFVGNNRYGLERGRLGNRLALDDGLLSVLAVATNTRTGLIWLAVRALTGRIDPARDFTVIGDCTRLLVRSRAGTIDVALDGEVIRLAPPLRFTVSPGALRICVPLPA
ncbi:diacylglycerol/lipid kinase family protein [Sphingomonas solaris]|uniref:DAGKc domain-containing protein n=1 Tax=Alterirhizorhabdus solaris TaxID=2529389 RepID=A0A558R6P0_9SPHN|nr:diacylglycerol kinase family protein [Sphingomonas solaris]TVV75049.1 hypothetical protein FOY91_08180 [Sphingomonas solaris]